MPPLTRDPMSGFRRFGLPSGLVGAPVGNRPGPSQRQQRTTTARPSAGAVPDRGRHSPFRLVFIVLSRRIRGDASQHCRRLCAQQPASAGFVHRATCPPERSSRRIEDGFKQPVGPPGRPDRCIASVPAPLGTAGGDDDLAGASAPVPVLSAPYLTHSCTRKGFVDEIHSLGSVHGELLDDCGDVCVVVGDWNHAGNSVRSIVAVHQAAPRAAMAPAVRSASAACAAASI